MLPAALPASLESKDKRHTCNLFFYNLPFWHICWASLSPTWKSVPLPIYYLCLSTCPKLQWLVPPSPCQTSMTMPVVVSTGPVSPETSHGCEVLLPPKYGKNSPSSSLCLPFPPETQKSLLFLPPSNCLMAFFTDRSRTNWRKGL